MARGNNNNGGGNGRRGGGGRRNGGGGGGRRGRSPSNSGSDYEDNNRGKNRNSNNVTAGSNSSSAPDYHFHVRRALRACVDDADFKAALIPEGSTIAVEELLDHVCRVCDTVVYALPTEEPLNYDLLSSSIRTIVSSHPKATGNTIAADRFTLVFIQRCRPFLTKMEPPTPAPQAQPARPPRSNTVREEGGGGGGGDDNRPTKMGRTEQRGGANNKNGNNMNTTNNGGGDQQGQQLGDSGNTNVGGVLGDYNGSGGIMGNPPPLLPTYGGVSSSSSLFSAPPTRGGGVLDLPPQQQQPYNQYQHNNNRYNNNNNNGVMMPPPHQHNNGGGGFNINAVAQHQYQQQQHAAALPPPLPVVDVGTRYLTLRNIPPALASRDSIKAAMEAIIVEILREYKQHHYHNQNIDTNFFFLNFDVFQIDTATGIAVHVPGSTIAEDGSVVPAPPLPAPTATTAYYAIVSFNTTHAASVVADRVNKMAADVAKANAIAATPNMPPPPPPVTAEGSNAEEIALFWGEARDQLEALEVEILTRFPQWDAAVAEMRSVNLRLAEISEQSAAADEAIKARNAELAELAQQQQQQQEGGASASSLAEQQLQVKEALKEALRTRLALNKEKEAVLARQTNAIAAMTAVDPSYVHGQSPVETYSSSSATPTNPRCLLFIQPQCPAAEEGAASPSHVAENLSDQKILYLLEKLQIYGVKHIWRDQYNPSAATPAGIGNGTLCLEMPVFGAVLGAMRRLDFLDCTFCNLKFTNEKPSKK